MFKLIIIFYHGLNCKYFDWKMGVNVRLAICVKLLIKTILKFCHFQHNFSNRIVHNVTELRN